MRHYETIYIINPNLSEKEYTETQKKYNDLLVKEKSVIIRVEEWGKQRLAYLVNKFDTGIYLLLNYCAEAGVTAQFERALRLDDKILLFQTVKLADKANPEELLMQEKGSKEVEPEVQDEGPKNDEVGDDNKNEVKNG